MALLPGTAFGQGNTYFVAPDGNDAHAGTETHPWQTIQKAANTLVAGDTAYIKAGTYRERVVPQNSGSAGRYITYAAYPGHVVILDGSGIAVPEYSGLFDVSGRSYIQVSGLRVMNSNQAGFLADGSSHVIIEKNYTYNTASSGIGVWGSHNIVVDGNQVELAGVGGWQECITVAGTDTFEVRNNQVLNCRKEGICTKDGAANGKTYRNYVHHTDHVGIYIDAWDKHTYNIEVFQNVVHDISQKDGFTIASEQGGLLENVKVYNNVAYNNGFHGLGISACCPGPASHPIRNIQIINNTFYNNGRSGWGGGIGLEENPDLQNVIIRNNISSQNLSFQIAVDPIVPPANLTVDHNLIDGYRGDEGEIYGNDYVEGDSQFVNPAGADFHLQSSSPAINQGSSNGAPLVDFDGYPRGALPDIGAYEWRRPGDMNGDGDVDTSDIQAVANCWHRQDCPHYYDQDGDGDVDIVDVMRVAARWGEPWPPSLSAVNDFLYQLQNLDLNAIGNTAYDLVVMDYSADGSATGEFTAAQINALKHSPGGEKIVLAYMSIGEAEDYRFYWQSGWTPGDPAWLDAGNPDWPGNYKVHYWDPAWQTIVFSYTDRLLDAGFDGAYLDIIDAYEYYTDQGRSTAAQEMADFVAAIRAHARDRDPDFYIFPQNAPELATLVPAYLNSVDGIGQEDIYYGYNADDEMTPPPVTAELEGHLDVFKNAGKPVLTIDYATTPARVDDAYAKSQARGYVPSVTVRELDQLTINPGHEPD